MSGEKIAIRAILCYLQENGLSISAAVKEINDGESPRTCGPKLVQMFQGR